MTTYNLMGRTVRDAQADETIVGSAGSLFDDKLVIYTPGTKEDGVVVRFKAEDSGPGKNSPQWEAYCNDVMIEIGPDGFVSSFDITKRRDGQ